MKKMKDKKLALDDIVIVVNSLEVSLKLFDKSFPHEEANGVLQALVMFRRQWI